MARGCPRASKSGASRRSRRPGCPARSRRKRARRSKASWPRRRSSSSEASGSRWVSARISGSLLGERGSSSRSAAAVGVVVRRTGAPERAASGPTRPKGPHEDNAVAATRRSAGVWSRHPASSGTDWPVPGAATRRAGARVSSAKRSRSVASGEVGWGSRPSGGTVRSKGDAVRPKWGGSFSAVVLRADPCASAPAGRSAERPSGRTHAAPGRRACTDEGQARVASAQGLTVS